MTTVIATAEQGNTFHSQGLALGAVLAETGFADDVRIVTSTGSVANAQMIGRGEAQFGFMAANWAPLAVGGEEPFARPIPLAMVSPVNSGPLFFSVRADSPVKTFADLRGRKVAVGYRDSGMARHVHTIFAALGWPLSDIDARYLNQAEGGEALARGEVEAQFQPPIPNGHFGALARTVRLRAVPFAAAEMTALLAKVPAYAATRLPAGAFPGHDEDMDLLAVLNVLVTGANESDERVEAVARLFAAESERLADKHALYASLPGLMASARRVGVGGLEAGGVKLHPAARRAFAAAGLTA